MYTIQYTADAFDMEYVLTTVVSHPLYTLGVLFSLASGVAFVIFLGGFFAGFAHLFTMDHNDKHMEHARMRATWGVLLLIALFLLWKVIRFLFG